MEHIQIEIMEKHLQMKINQYLMGKNELIFEHLQTLRSTLSEQNYNKVPLINSDKYDKILDSAYFCLSLTSFGNFEIQTFSFSILV